MQIPRSITLFLVLLALTFVYLAGLQVDVMDVDASQYASITLEMLQNGEYLQVQHLGHDYLDKPPLLFWTSALAFKLFGVHNWSYKIFSLLFSVLAAYSTYRFAKLYYTQQIAVWSAFILASCQAMFLINNDVRTDTMLIGAVMFAIWQIADYLRTSRWVNLLGISAGIALAMLTKGPIGLMVPVLAFVSDWVFKRQWRNFFRWQWLVVVVLVGVLLSPMLYGLYQQHGNFGPYFYFWAQSFGRLTGDNPFINSGMGTQPPSPFFFVHTFLWSFLPWSLLALGGFWLSFRQFFKNLFRVPVTEEVITLWGFILPFIALSFSAYKLPHYIYVLLPFAAVLAARFADTCTQKKGIQWLQIGLSLSMFVLALLLTAWAFPGDGGALKFSGIFGGIFFVLLRFHKEEWLLICLYATIGANWLLGGGIYPEIMKYQSTSMAGKDIAALKPTNTLSINVRGHALDFYAQQRVPYYESIPAIAPNSIIYTNAQGLQELKEAGHEVAILHTYPHYKVTALTLPFINPATRASKLQERYLVEVR